MTAPRAALAIWRSFGVRGVWYRTVFEGRKATHRFRSEPAPVPHIVASSALPHLWPFVPDRERVRAAAPREAALERAERVAAGEHHAYRWTWAPLPRDARAWRVHPASGVEYDPATPWYRVPHFDARAGDIKDVWEPARFAWAYDLARGWMLTGDDRFARAFWERFDDFVTGCAPFRGVQWACGQETAIRAVALLWAEGAMADAPSSTPARLARLRSLLAVSGERIADAIGYALSQGNNHAISEAVGLVAVGARFRDSDPRARVWLRRGGRWLGRLAREQFAADGWYVQHSLNYMRLALDQMVVGERVLRYVRTALPPSAVERVGAAVRMLSAVIDPATGDVPIYGANDGAYVLPLSTRPYRDYVPAVTAAAVTFGAALPAEIQPDAESLAWLGAARPAADPPRSEPRVCSGASGWFDAATTGARAFGRATGYRTRPGHIDPLHLDVWLAGRHVATDAGTYRYAAPDPWANGLADIDVHNTLRLAARPAARRGPRFLWLTWPRGRIIRAEALGDGVRIELENLSWNSVGIAHRRVCELLADGVLVTDDVSVPRERVEPVALQWLLDGDADDIAIDASWPVTVRTVRGDDASVHGWISEGYGVKRPATSVTVEVEVAGGALRIVTGFGSCRAPDRLRAALDAPAMTPDSTLVAVASAVRSAVHSKRRAP